MTARWWAFGLWALAAASAVAWGLRALAQPQPVPEGATVAAAAPPQGDWTRLFGADPPPEPAAAEAPPPALAARFQLVGVAAARGGTGGVALLAVDGKPPRAVRVGAVVDGDLVLQSVDRRAASIGPRGAAPALTLELPPLPPPATGQLPPAGAPGAPAAFPGPAGVPGAALPPGARPPPAVYTAPPPAYVPPQQPPPPGVPQAGNRPGVLAAE